MPNYVFNKVHFFGNENRIKELRKLVETDETAFDFNRIAPMPESLNLPHGSSETLAIACAYAKSAGKTTCEEFEKGWRDEKSFDEWTAIGEKYLDNIEKYGCTTWYDWCYENWGTKWNACEPIWSGANYVTFNTAWSSPVPIYKKLTELFPDVSFEVTYADEDLGNNCGVITWNQREGFIDSPMDDFDFACDVWGYDPDEMRREYAESFE